MSEAKGEVVVATRLEQGERAFQIDFDFVEHVLWIRTSDGHFRQLVLSPRPVTEFHTELFATLAALDISVPISTMPWRRN